MTESPPSVDLPDMPISVLSNGLILRLLESGKITIDPFDVVHLAPTAYRLAPHRVRFHIQDEEGLLSLPEVVSLDTIGGRDLRPGEYAVVSPRERISLEPGLIADFFPSSWCIENNLLITVAR